MSHLPLFDPPRSFHVRSHMRVDEAAAGEKQARGQEAEVLAYLQARPRQRLTPPEVLEGLDRGRDGSWPETRRPWPLTSVRRALTNLTDAGAIVHHPADRKPGAYGALNSTWSFEP